MTERTTNIETMLRFVAGECDEGTEAQVRASILHNHEERGFLNDIQLSAWAGFHRHLMLATILNPPESVATGKRWIRVTAVAILVILTAPLLLLVALLVRLTSSGPAFCSEMICGRNGKPFRMYKMRTMYRDWKARFDRARWWSDADDPRITPIGHFLRRTWFDKLPQLWNVLRGDMGLVGPQAEQSTSVAIVVRSIARYKERFCVRPGITGLAQLLSPVITNLRSAERKLAYDLYYIRNQSLWLDLRILLATTLMFSPWLVHHILPFSEEAVMEGMVGVPGATGSADLQPETGN